MKITVDTARNTAKPNEPRWSGWRIKMISGALTNTVGDPRGPVRTVIAIEKRSDATLLTKSCGHTGRHAAHFAYRVGEESRCMECRYQGVTK